jgi:osmoprotectant transport system substrate-binding protein
MLDRRAFLSGSIALLAAGCRSSHGDIVVGSKNFTEQLILGEMFAQVLERACREPVQRRFYLAGTYICQQAILAGRIDVYPEYTGTALAAVLKQKAAGDAGQVYEEVKREYQSKFGLAVMPPLGFNNSFAMVMRSEDAQRAGIMKLSQMAVEAPRMRLGVGYEFLERPDGYQGLVRTYGLKFAQAPQVMDLGLLYRALQNRAVDIVAGSNTDGLIAALGLVVLEDDRRYFPPYDAVPIVRSELLDSFPAAQHTFERLAGRISAEQMRTMNYAVDGQHQDAASVVHEFLLHNSLIQGVGAGARFPSTPRPVSGGEMNPTL